MRSEIGSDDGSGVDGREPEGRRPRSADDGEAAGGRRGERQAVDAEVPIAKAIQEAPIGVTIGDARWDHAPLVYVNDAFEELTGYETSWALGRSCSFLQGEATRDEPVAELRRAIEEDVPVSVELRNYRADGSQFWNRVTLAPLRDGDGEVTHYVGFQEDVTERRRAEEAAERQARELRAQRESLQQVLDRVEGLVTATTASLASATTPEEVRSTLADCLSDYYATAWVGERDPVEETLEPLAAGEGAEPEPLALDGAVEEALSTGSLVVDYDRPEGPDRAAAYLPLASQGRTRGVAVVRDVPGAFDDREPVVLEAVGDVAATALDARESQRLLTADEVIRLTFELPAGDLGVADLIERLGCTAEFVGTVTEDESLPGLFFELTGVDDDSVAAAVEDAGAAVEVVRGGDGGALVEFTPAEAGVVHTLSTHNAQIAELTVSGGGATVVVDIPPTAEARAVGTALRERYPEAELVGKTERSRPGRTRREFLHDLEEALTERQAEALQRAYFGGFFEWPHASSGEELADSMGVSRSTYHQHLRAAQRKVIGEFCEGRGPLRSIDP